MITVGNNKSLWLLIMQNLKSYVVGLYLYSSVGKELTYTKEDIWLTSPDFTCGKNLHLLRI